MSSGYWASATIALSVGAVFACGVSASNQGGGPQGDLPTGPSCTSSCNACAQSKCGAKAACLASQCADFSNCFCVCDAGDTTCQFPCVAFQTPDNHCGDCVAAANPCLKQQCAAECPDLNPSLSSGTFDSGAGGSTVFPFQGPSCPASCGQCIQDHCATAGSCLATDCAAYYGCSCACDPADLLCLTACLPSSACQTCGATSNACVQQNCSTCAGGGDGGAGSTGDGGLMFFGGDGGADASAWCTQLASCCAVLASSLNQTSCNYSLSLGSSIECQSALASFQSAGDCP